MRFAHTARAKALLPERGNTRLFLWCVAGRDVIKPLAQ